MSGSTLIHIKPTQVPRPARRLSEVRQVLSERFIFISAARKQARITSLREINMGIIKATGIIVAVSVVILMVVALIMERQDQIANARNPAGISGAAPVVQAAEDPKLTAESIARAFMRQRLANSADFPATGSAEYKTAFLGGTSYRVVAWVDTVNQAGVKVRYPWGATVTGQGDKDWRLEALTINGQQIVGQP